MVCSEMFVGSWLQKTCIWKLLALFMANFTGNFEFWGILACILALEVRSSNLCHVYVHESSFEHPSLYQ